MKVVILAGGMGSRLSEETQIRPKPMVEIGPYPILWHILRHYSHYGLNDFIICLGYKGYVIKEYFANYVLHRSDILVDVEKNRIEYLGSQALPPWRVALVDTGQETKTGGRLKRIAGHLSADEPFCMTYGDGVSDVDLMSLITFHKKGRNRNIPQATVSRAGFSARDRRAHRCVRSRLLAFATARRRPKHRLHDVGRVFLHTIGLCSDLRLRKGSSFWSDERARFRDGQDCQALSASRSDSCRYGLRTPAARRHCENDRNAMDRKRYADADLFQRRCLSQSAVVEHQH
jgi:hypothetical protein